MSEDFRFFKLGMGSRIALAASLWVLGVAAQLALGASLPGIILVIAGWFPLMLKPATNKPDDQGFEEWRPVTMAEIDRLDDGLRQSRKLRKKTSFAGTGILVSVGVPLLLFALFVTGVSEARGASILLLNAAAFLLPSLAFGRVRVFMPKDIDMKMPSFRAALSAKLPTTIAVAPYIRFDKDPAGRDVPEDLRLMFELKRPPADLVGIQVQAAVNKGPNGEVPYLYAVVLTKGRDGPSYAFARRLRAKGYEVEPGGNDEYGSVVIRQETSGTGYHTTAQDCERLATLCGKVLEGIAGGGAS